MIKNIVFDYGNVMVRFEPSYMVGKYVSDEKDSKLLEKVLFDRLYWDRLDDGTIEDEELLALAKERIPERLWGASREIFYDWINNLPEVEGMKSLVLHVKNDLGMRVFLLSNISRYFAEHAHERAELAPFEKCIFSAVVGRMKPNRDMFEYLLSECHILPEETRFIDDSEKNVKGAEACGIHGYLFDGDSEKLGKYIENL